jgi:hypothetical protein
MQRKLASNSETSTRTPRPALNILDLPVNVPPSPAHFARNETQEADTSEQQVPDDDSDPETESDTADMGAASEESDDETHERGEDVEESDSENVGTEDEDSELFGANVRVCRFDWVAIRLEPTKSNHSKSTNTKAAMYLGQIQAVDEDDDTCTVHYLRKQTDNSYCWPDKVDWSLCQRKDMVRIGGPRSGGTTRTVAKLFFDPKGIENARVILGIAQGNVH